MILIGVFLLDFIRFQDLLIWETILITNEDTEAEVPVSELERLI